MIVVTLFVEYENGNVVTDAQMSVTNGTYDWNGITNGIGHFTVNIDYTPTIFTLNVTVSKANYTSDQEFFVIYIDPPAVDYTEPFNEYNHNFLALIGLICLPFIGLWVANSYRKKKHK